MCRDSMNVSLETLIAASPLLGHELEDRTSISQGQDPLISEYLLEGTSTWLRSNSQRNLFCVAPLDILVSQQQGRKQFHLLELNGTGIGGLTNMPPDSVASILDSLAESTGEAAQNDGVVLLAVSGKESDSSPRRNRLMHEKLLFLEAMRRGMVSEFGRGTVNNLDQLRARASDRTSMQPTAVIGYIKDFLSQVQLDAASV
jgi:hypothetical protein